MLQILQNLFALTTVAFYAGPLFAVLVLLTIFKRKFKLGSVFLSNEEQKLAVKALNDFPVSHHFYTSKDGLKLHYVYKKAKNGQNVQKKGVIIFIHGFPSIWFSWKKQIEYFSNIGYDVVAPDMRGYNDSDKDRLAIIWNYDFEKESLVHLSQILLPSIV